MPPRVPHASRAVTRWRPLDQTARRSTRQECPEANERAGCTPRRAPIHAVHPPDAAPQPTPGPQLPPATHPLLRPTPQCGINHPRAPHPSQQNRPSPRGPRSIEHTERSSFHACRPSGGMPQAPGEPQGTARQRRCVRNPPEGSCVRCRTSIQQAGQIAVHLVALLVDQHVRAERRPAGSHPQTCRSWTSNTPSGAAMASPICSGSFPFGAHLDEARGLAQPS